MAPIDPYPEEQARDRVRSAADAGLEAVPFVGGSVAKVLEMVLTPSITKRRDAWHRELAEAVDELASRQITPQQLAADEEWVSAVFEASRVALGTHVETKLAMLRQLLVNMAIERPRGANQVIVRRFLRFIEELDEEHFILLKYASDPGRWFDAKGLPRPSIYSGPRSAALDQSGIELTRDARNLVLRDLNDRGLLNADGFSGMVSQAAILNKLTTGLGDQLLRWVWAFE